MPWDRPDVPGAFTLEETRRRLGACRWVELRLYEAMGGWVPTIPELDVRLFVGTACRAHAWHAEMLGPASPAAASPPASPAATSPPASPAADEGVVALLEAVAGAEGTLERVVGAYRVVVPRLVAAYTAHTNRTSAVTDPALARALRLVLADEVAAWQEGELVVQSLVTDAPAAARAAAHQGRLEALIAASGGLAGPSTLRPG